MNALIAILFQVIGFSLFAVIVRMTASLLPPHCATNPFKCPASDSAALFKAALVVEVPCLRCLFAAPSRVVQNALKLLDVVLPAAEVCCHTGFDFSCQPTLPVAAEKTIVEIKGESAPRSLSSQ